MPPKIGSSTSSVSDHFPASGTGSHHGSTPSPVPSTRAGSRGNEALRGVLAQRGSADAGPATAGGAGLRRTNSMSRLADFSRAALERQTSLPTTSKERLQAGSLLTRRDTERPADSKVASDATTVAKPSLKLGDSSSKPTPASTPNPGPRTDAQSTPATPASHASGSAPTSTPAPAPAYGYPAHAPYWHAPTYRTHQFGAHRPIGFSYGHGKDAYGSTHAHVGFHYFGRHHTFRFSVSNSMSSLLSSSFLSGFRSGLLNPVVYHAPPSTGYANYGSYVPPYAGHHFHAGGYPGHHPYAIGHPAPYAMGYPVGAGR